MSARVGAVAYGTPVDARLCCATAADCELLAWYVQLTDRRFQGLSPFYQTLDHGNTLILRLKRRGLRFEIACFKKKLAEWRSGEERDLDEVMPMRAIFSNISKVRR